MTNLSNTLRERLGLADPVPVPFHRDADQVVARIPGDFITGFRVDRGHALDQERFAAIVEWIVERVSAR